MHHEYQKLQTQLAKLQARLNDLYARQASLGSTRALTQSQIAESENALSHSHVSALISGSNIALRANLGRTAADLARSSIANGVRLARVAA